MGWDTSNNMDSGPGHRPGSMTWANKTIGVGPTKNVNKNSEISKVPKPHGAVPKPHGAENNYLFLETYSLSLPKFDCY